MLSFRDVTRHSLGEETFTIYIHDFGLLGYDTVGGH
jgi:hypothetical protein